MPIQPQAYIDRMVGNADFCRRLCAVSGLGWVCRCDLFYSFSARLALGCGVGLRGFFLRGLCRGEGAIVAQC
jgi:hypothetical protein